MRRVVLFIVVVAALLSSVAVFLNYERWFVYPSKRIFVSSKLTDPDGATYRNERITPAGWLCGEVNWKNQAGGYTGYSRFSSSSADDVYLERFGYVGNDPASTKRVMDRLDTEINLLKSLNLAAQVAGQKPNVSQAEIGQLVNSQIFEAQWRAQCAN